MVEFDTSEPRFLQPWRCPECKQLMYNVDEQGRPTLGAPIGLAIGTEGNRRRICTLCAEMYIAASESRYMTEQHMDWVKEQERRRQKLGVKGSYLDSNN